MRKNTWLALIAVALLPAVYARADTKVVVKEIVTITVDKSKVRTDVPPINVNGQTLVPIRGVFEALNASIDWLPTDKVAVIQDTGRTLRLTIGDDRANVNGAMVPLSVPAMIYRGRTMVPLRFVAETLGSTVSWDPETQTITILTRSRVVPVPGGIGAANPPPKPASPPKTVTPPEPEPQPAEKPATVNPDESSPSDSGQPGGTEQP